MESRPLLLGTKLTQSYIVDNAFLFPGQTLHELKIQANKTRKFLDISLDDLNGVTINFKIIMGTLYANNTIRKKWISIGQITINTLFINQKEDMQLSLGTKWGKTINFSHAFEENLYQIPVKIIFKKVPNVDDVKQAFREIFKDYQVTFL